MKNSLPSRDPPGQLHFLFSVTYLRRWMSPKYLLTQRKGQSLKFQSTCVKRLLSSTCACVLSHIRLFAAPWTVAWKAPLPMEFSRQEYQHGVPFPTPGNLPNPGVKPVSLASLALAGGFFTTSAAWAVPSSTYQNKIWEHLGKNKILFLPRAKSFMFQDTIVPYP